MRLPFYDLEGALVEWKKLDVLCREYVFPVQHHDGRYGNRHFVLNNSGEFHQREPIEWKNPLCLRCGKPEDDPIHEVPDDAL